MSIVCNPLLTGLAAAFSLPAPLRHQFVAPFSPSLGLVLGVRRRNQSKPRFDALDCPRLCPRLNALLERRAPTESRGCWLLDSRSVATNANLYRTPVEAKV